MQEIGKLPTRSCYYGYNGRDGLRAETDPRLSGDNGRYAKL